jgi:SRSO17 transposase
VLTSAVPKGHHFLDRRLDLPEEWCADTARRQKAQVPEGVTLQIKPEQALAMLEHAWAHGVPMRWVTGDEVYGNAPRLLALYLDSGRRHLTAALRPAHH